ncbi:helix-turn-helix domain-containing protein [Bacillus cereus]|uniref:helix-turn-helix domain-containing protein n=1 Tax=Bacillus cereus TaxID=1396 RepID=UPI002405695F|nr:helix-turn-helix domain-containing protein [Bacillus cereus]MDF9503753.1 helix-turn-helix domain-containing protein [Bacillus cereus]MDF9597387.1 helix-turn-helix domain-containing protein [Bacillus cereus]MDF9609468.1 helix-turn-helix domain-containing protein [Bacillus cereus]MDF9660427.1 helix-turn-helix domain-containing protein [Bacillus cereus]
MELELLNDLTTELKTRILSDAVTWELINVIVLDHLERMTDEIKMNELGVGMYGVKWEDVNLKPYAVLDNVIGVNDAHLISGLSPGHIKNLCAAGAIESKKIGGTWVINRERFEEWVKCSCKNETNSTQTKYCKREVKSI